MTNEYEGFVHKFLPEIIAGASRSQVMHQYGGTELKYYFAKVQIAPPVFRSPQGLRLDSFSQAFRRKSTLACVVLADVHHETREFRDCLTVEDVHRQFTRGVRGTGWRAVKGEVRGGRLHGHLAGGPGACPPVAVPAETAAKFDGKAVVIILPFPEIEVWGEAWKFAPEDVFVQATRKPFSNSACATYHGTVELRLFSSSPETRAVPNLFEARRRRRGKTQRRWSTKRVIFGDAVMNPTMKPD